MAKKLSILRNDPWLEPFSTAIEGRHQDVIKTLDRLTSHTGGSLSSFANAYNYYGLHRDTDGHWIFRELAPNATNIWLIGTFNNWQKDEQFRLHPADNGVWEGKFPAELIHNGDLYKMYVQWAEGEGERIPAYATRVVQDENTKIFSAEVYEPEKPYTFKIKKFKPDTEPLLIYECHIGMAQEKEGVGTYDEFRSKILPRIAKDGYNAIQIMAIQEHPYYGSFGYHVSSFYAPSSRFGTPDDLKRLIDEAHKLGLAVIMDIVHSHAVKNEVEGLGRLDGSYDLYFYGDGRREHPAWDSLIFDYGKDNVLHFLLSNCKYWLEEFHFDGFRFDGVTSMLYYDHGLGKAFGGYADYYDGNQDTNAITYLTLANILIHDINRNAITIAEEMSGMPGLAVKFDNGGMGFDYRMAMGIPDYWIKTIKEKKDEDWHPTSIFWELTNRRSDEKTISYCESHDQALVGDKTIIFRLIDKEMYWHMSVDDNNSVVERGMALHKMIRLVTLASINGGYLNFMGNEFGHPEWIDFPRDGNGWSYKYARRQWELVDRDDLKYKFLNRFDNAMVGLVSEVYGFENLPVEKLWEKDDDQVLAFRRGNLIFVFNWNPVKSFSDYGFLAPAGEYEVVLDSDNLQFGGFGNVDDTVHHFTSPDPLYSPAGKGWLKMYLPARSAQVLKLIQASPQRNGSARKTSPKSGMEKSKSVSNHTKKK
ncbi:MAG: alpha amylase C-terminal domain-containing protein [Prevotella sp.]|nr:alpha amylase C-terminal domain-containing protein [Bacteroides sp.]MCM1366593.1 alpha amylase C-terminal domain-containing protein [Prevotella sp.]MCM1437310.1 alpha amylase C-terminal domain-containing protein [Prevotella sp.]